MWKYGFIIAILSGAAFVSVNRGKLTVIAAVTGCFLGLFIFLGAGYIGLTMLGTFFVLGTVATSWQVDVKERLGIAEEERGRRQAGQVIANAGIAGVLGLLIRLYPEKAALFQVMIAACFSSATADTLSSELGNVYGTKFYNILTFQKDQRGLNGVISIEGTTLGVTGSIIIALIYALGFGWNINVLWIVLSGTVGNLSDSILGATLEHRHYLNNNAVNFLNTLIAAITGLLLSLIK